jgi:hypothetical protein
MKVIKDNKYPIVFAIVQWFITTLLQVDRAFFIYDSETKVFLIVKALYLIFLIVSWCFGVDAYKKLRSGNEDYKRGLYVFTFYLVIMMLLLLILWPGTWSWDDLFTLTSIQLYSEFCPWQHIVTGIYQDIMLQILPFPGGIIFLQNVIVSLCVAVSVTKLEKAYNIRRFKNLYLDMIVKFIPFLLPPVLMYQFSGYRIGLYVYLELVMLVILICAIRDKKEWNWRYILLFCFLCVIVATWRTESLFYIPFTCILLYFVDRVTLPKIKKIICIVLLILGFWGMNSWQNHALGNSNYQVISLMGPCVDLVRTADYVEDADLLYKINKVASVEVIHNNPDSSGEALYWRSNVIQEGYTEKDYSDLLKAFVKLSLKYPKTVIAERWNVFIAGAGITGSTRMNVSEAAALFDENNQNNAANATLPKGWIANTPVFKTMRTDLINILGGIKADGTVVGVAQRLIWNAIFPMILLLYAWFKLFIQKKWHLWFLCTAVLIRIPVVVLTQPAGCLMYFLSFYFLGYVFIVYKVLIHFSDKRVKDNE